MTGGIFAEYQPQYAALGIATFPVREKRPAVAQYLKMGLPASRSLAEKFAGCEGLGFACGTRNNIVVLDVDSPSEKLLADALDEFGPTPFVVRSASGNHQAWYRHNGETRKIRPDKSRPIDILGGGYVVAPPSRTSKGAYTIISGSLQDLPHLPVMRSLVQPQALNNNEPPAPERVKVGSRNDALWRLCMEHARGCAGWDALMAFAIRVNSERLSEPLPPEEVIRVVESAWQKEAAGENFLGGRRGLVLGHEQVDRLLAEPDAFHLLATLRRHHWGREFVCANAMAATMPGGSWRRERFAAARACLERMGEIEMLRPASKQRGPAIYQFKGAQK